MKDVLLHEYVEEMRRLLRERDFPGVLALGDHILCYYPKHLETYSLLAQTRLEMDDLDAASDLFQRVRSADPENAVALFGLSIIHEREGHPDEALWHMERAFELQPSSGELRRELIRLHAACEGAPPARIKLTSAGLARLYARQGLTAQAIQEFQNLLRTEPDRMDLQVALAEAFYREGYKQEAAAAAGLILQKLPFCVKANLLLGSLLAENDVAESQDLLKRALAVDPESLMARELDVSLDGHAPPVLPELGARAAMPMPPATVAAPERVEAEAPLSAEEEAPSTEFPSEELQPEEAESTGPRVSVSIEEAGEAASAAGTEAGAQVDRELGWLDSIYRLEPRPGEPAAAQAASPERLATVEDMLAEPVVSAQVAEPAGASLPLEEILPPAQPPAEEPPAAQAAIEEIVLPPAPSETVESMAAEEPAAEWTILPAQQAPTEELAAEPAQPAAAELETALSEPEPEPETRAEPEVSAPAPAEEAPAERASEPAPAAAEPPSPVLVPAAKIGPNLPRVAPTIPGALDGLPDWTRAWLSTPLPEPERAPAVAAIAPVRPAALQPGEQTLLLSDRVAEETLPAEQVLPDIEAAETGAAVEERPAETGEAAPAPAELVAAEPELAAEQVPPEPVQAEVAAEPAIPDNPQVEPVPLAVEQSLAEAAEARPEAAAEQAPAEAAESAPVVAADEPVPEVVPIEPPAGAEPARAEIMETEPAAQPAPADLAEPEQAVEQGLTNVVEIESTVEQAAAELVTVEPAEVPEPMPAPAAESAPVAEEGHAVEPPAESAALVEETVPDWLRELTGQAAVEEKHEEAIAEPEAKDELLEWLSGEAREPQVQPQAQLQAAEPSPEANLPAADPAVEQPVVQAEEPAPQAPESEVQAPVQAQEPAAPPEPVPPPAPAPIRSTDPTALLEAAREFRAAGNLEGALEYYEQAMQRGQRIVPSVISDLEELVQKQPDAPVRALRLLGDAYAAAGRFQEALAQYRLVLNR